MTRNNLKIVLNLWDGVRFDAIWNVHRWMGLPNFMRVARGGVLFTNLYTTEPVLTPLAVGKIMRCDFGRGPWLPTVLRRLGKRSALAGYPEAEKKMEWIPDCAFPQVLYNRGLEAEIMRRDGWLHMHRYILPDHVRMQEGCRRIPHNDFTFVYFAKPDEKAHVCRDRGKHIYHHGSPYVHSIKECDRLLGHVLQTLDKVAPNNYVIIIVADHGMTDEGRHSIAHRGQNPEVMHVPMAIMGRGIRSNWMEQGRYFTHDVPEAVIQLAAGNPRHAPLLRWATR